MRRLAKAHEHVANRRRDTAHKSARHLVNIYGLIAFEDLNTPGLVRTYPLAKSIADAGWRPLVALTMHKVVSAGRRVVLVDAHYTSQDCSRDGCTDRKTDLTLVDRTCPQCGILHDRDVNAACTILQGALAS